VDIQGHINLGITRIKLTPLKKKKPKKKKDKTDSKLFNVF